MIALGVQTKTIAVAVAINPPIFQFDPLFLSLINALLVVVFGLVLTGLLLLLVVSPAVYLPALTAALWALWEGVELLIKEVRNGRR